MSIIVWSAIVLIFLIFVYFWDVVKWVPLVLLILIGVSFRWIWRLLGACLYGLLMVGYKLRPSKRNGGWPVALAKLFTLAFLVFCVVYLLRK